MASLVLSRASKHADDDPFPELDGNATRGKVLFRDGLLYDLFSGSARRAKTLDRMGCTTGCSYQPCRRQRPRSASWPS